MPPHSPRNSTNKYQNHKLSKTASFHIRIGNNHAQKINLKDPAFLKLLQQQYATKYLQSLGVQTTQKNIFKILKSNPIQNCQIIQSRLNGGLYTDTITIIPRTQAQINQNNLKDKNKQQVSSQMIQILDLKRMGDKKYSSLNNNGTIGINNPNSGINGNSKLNGIQNSINQQGIDFLLNSQNNQDGTNNRGLNSQFRINNSKGVFIDKSNNNFDDSFNVNNNKNVKNRKTENNITQNKNNDGLKYLCFDIQSMKEKYIFPFNDNFKRKSNFKLTDNSNLIEPQNPKIVYQSKIFNFPFTQVKLSLKILKQLQNPIDTKLSQIQQFLDNFYQQFPVTMFPIVNENQLIKQSSNTNQANLKTSLNPQLLGTFQSSLTGTNNLKTQSSKTKTYMSNSSNSNHPQINLPINTQQKPLTKIIFKNKQIDQMFQILRSQSNAKMIGVFLHLAYWSIFGGVNPIQIQANMKKKMYIMMFQTFQYFQIKIQNKKLWSNLICPMILLTLKMAAHYFFQLQYPKIFQNQDSVKTGVNELAYDKIYYLIQKMFDPSNINGRFIFLQSQITGAKGTFLKDKQYIRKRIFGTSPALQIMLPNPLNGKTRSIMAKNIEKQKKQPFQLQFGKISGIKNYKLNVDQNRQCRQKLLCLALHKINNRLEQIQGHSSQMNPIINLKI